MYYHRGYQTMNPSIKKKIKTVFVEDEVRILENICSKIVELDPSFEIVGTAQNGHSALEVIERERPQVVFPDILALTTPGNPSSTVFLIIF